MSKRAEFKRRQKESAKIQKKLSVQNGACAAVVAPLNVANYSVAQIAAATGTRIEYLTIWKNAREAEMRKAAILESQEKLWKAEDYLAVANILITVYALKMSRKSRERTKDLINRMIDNLNAAKEYVERTGIEKAYEQAHQDFGIELKFDSMDLNKEFGFDEFDFREEGFEDKSGIEIWNEAWDTAKDIGNVINTCSIGITLKRVFGFSDRDMKILIEESNKRADKAKNDDNGVTKMIEEFEGMYHFDIGKRNKELVRRYGL